MSEEIALEFERLVLKCAKNEESLDSLVTFARKEKIQMGPTLDRLKLKEVMQEPVGIVFTKLTLRTVRHAS